MGTRVNCLILNNEVWALSLRLKYEYDFYDTFIVTESRMTFAGAKKPLYFEKYRHEIPDPDGKIIYDVIDELPIEHDVVYMTQSGKTVTGNRWPAEHAMRNSCARVLRPMGLGASDIVVIQDVDEIANIDAVRTAGERLAENEIHRLVHHDFRETVHPSGLQRDPWYGGIMFRGTRVHEDYHDMRRLHVMKDVGVAHWHIQGPMFVSRLDGTPMYDLIRRPDLKSTRADPSKEPMGWHFSSMSGGFDKLRAHKTNSFAHAEFDAGSTPESDDFWAETQRFIKRARARRGYFISKLSPRLPDFVRDSIKDYLVLLKPKAAG